MRPSTFNIHAALFIPTVISGINYVVVKDLIPEYMSPIAAIVLRIVGGTICFWLFHITTKSEKKIQRKDLWVLALLSLFGASLNQLAFYEGMIYTNPVNASVIMLMTPILVMAITVIVNKEKLRKRQFFGLLLGFIGAFLIIGGSNLSFSGDTVRGDTLVLFNALLYGVYLVLVKPYMIKYDGVTVTKWVFLFGNFVVIPFGITDVFRIEWQLFTPYIWAVVAFIILLMTFVNFQMNAWAMQYVTPSLVGFYMYFQPFTATVIAYIVGKGELTLQTTFYSVLIFVGVYLVNKKSES
jgi:drug/metabolite transporter (DMT)-like permease